ncbi:DUF2971 domain-containing protein [Pseudocolwellia sp. HL-MZ7]|uniref:DUF2971 domain-containing protein n=1 Tax=Pseudocolwellia sp. HL-MZ7 TaxID=3400627 RepID=UPI003CF3C39A
MSSFYKYSPIKNLKNLEDEHSLNNLFSSRVAFSRRKSFNDLFDSQVKFIIPNKHEIKQTYKSLSGKSKLDFKHMFIKGSGSAGVDNLKSRINGILDSYLFYCLTDNPRSNLMWSHYASSHNGFCIEWDGNFVKPQKIKYQQSIPEFDLLQFIKKIFGLLNDTSLLEEAWAKLNIKLDEWEYEQEYRFQLSNSMESLIVEDMGNIALVQAQPEWVKSIVFGYRMGQDTRNYIIDRLPSDMKYKEIIICSNQSELKVVNYSA